MPDDPRSPITATVYLDHLDRESGRFADVLAGVDPAVPVPTCPGWTAADLVWHLTEVQWFWGSIAGGRITDEDAADAAEEDKPPRPTDYRELLALCGTARERLTAAVADGPDDAALWSWAAEQTLRFTRRRQAHEALIHRVDAELTAGLAVRSIDARLAADGIDEVLTVMWGDVPEWASFSSMQLVVALETTDTADAWMVELGRMIGTSPRSGRSYDEPTTTLVRPGSRPADALVRGGAADLDLLLWNRGNTGVDRSGDQGALDGLATLIAAGVQ
ncbi:MAG: maleylpyruvate isomerase family mycothiol-dependent enzyme [Geodermatophilaceae bacterium]